MTVHVDDNVDIGVFEDSEEEVNGDDGDDEYAPEEDDFELEDDDDEDDDEEAFVDESTSEKEEEDPLGPWGEKHPEIDKEIHSNSRVKFSSSENKYILKWMIRNPTLGARALYNCIQSCPHARKVFHFHHVEYPERIDSKFKDMRKALMK